MGEVDDAVKALSSLATMLKPVSDSLDTLKKLQGIPAMKAQADALDKQLADKIEKVNLGVNKLNTDFAKAEDSHAARLKDLDDAFQSRRTDVQSQIETLEKKLTDIQTRYDAMSSAKRGEFTTLIKESQDKLAAVNSELSTQQAKLDSVMAQIKQLAGV